MRKAISLLLLCFATLLTSGAAYGLVHFDFEQKYFREPGVVVKDHCLVKVDSIFHLFYLRGNPAVNIGHATSKDLISWTIEEPVLLTTQGGWDSRALWAPHIIYAYDSFLMFFTGVNEYWAQQTGMALSSDLYNWSKLPYPLYHPDPAWAEWSETSWSNGRDPFVFHRDGMYYMLVTAKTNNNLGAIASAISTDLANWTDNGPLYVHDTWHVLESPFLLERDGKLHLFFTEEIVNGTSHMASDSLYGGWDIATRIVLDPGHAPEVNLLDGKYIFSRHSVFNDNHGHLEYIIAFDELRWSGDMPYVYRPWPLEDKWDLIWGGAFSFQPVFGNNPYSRGDTVDVNLEGDSWIGTYEMYQGPLKYGLPGGAQGDEPKGVIRSHTFVLTGNSMNLLVGGGNYPNECYVALVDAATEQVLYRETGKNSDHMDRRYWDLTPYKGTQVYIEIADLSSSYFGHINCDDITESMVRIGRPGDQGSGKRGYKAKPKRSSFGAETSAMPKLYQNYPNPFNPTTTITYYLPAPARVTIDLFDARGRKVEKLFDSTQREGEHSVLWNPGSSPSSGFSSGIYFCRLSVDGKVVATRKMVYLK